jgi:hypothetical protein
MNRMETALKVPIDVANDAAFTVAQWRSFAPVYGARTWPGAMRRYALKNGRAVAILRDDSALIMTLDPTSPTGTRTQSVPASEVNWLSK